MEQIRNISILLLAFFSSQSYSAVVWDWEINNPNVVAQPNETVVFFATIYNDISSEILGDLDTNPPDEVSDITLWAGSLLPNNIFNEYEFDIGVEGFGTIRSQFFGVTIAPGESFQFVLYTLIPRGGSVELGAYIIEANTLFLEPSIPDVIPRPIYGIDFGATTITVVPIPSAMSLFGIALLPLFFRKLKKLTSCRTIAQRKRCAGLSTACFACGQGVMRQSEPCL